MKKTTKARAGKIKRALYRQFQCRSCDPKWNTQQNLQAIGSHYADDDTLKYFKARILDSRDIAHGLLFWVRSTVGRRQTGSNGRHRLVVFDLFGSGFQEFDGHCAKSVEDQLKEWAETFDVGAYYKEHGLAHANRLAREASELRKALR